MALLLFIFIYILPKTAIRHTSTMQLVLVYIKGGHQARCSVAIFASHPIALFPYKHLHHVVY